MGSMLSRMARLPTSQKAILAAIIALGGVWLRKRMGAKTKKRVTLKSDKDLALTGKKKKKKERSFVARLRSILRIIFAGKESTNAMFNLAGLTGLLVARTLLSIQVAMLTGDIARFLVESNWNKFVQSLIRFALLGIPAALVNSGLKYSTNMFALRARKGLTDHIVDTYCSGTNFYKATQLPLSKIENVDQRVTADVEAFAEQLAKIYSSLFKPILDISLNTFKLSSMMGLKAPIVLFVYYGALAQIKLQILKIIRLKQNVQQNSALQGDYRTAHQRLITYSEEIAFFEGADRERTIITALFGSLFRHTAYVNRLRGIVGVLDQYLIKYGSSITGYGLLCLPVFFAPVGTGPRTTADLTRAYVLNRQLLMDLSTGIGHLLSVQTKIASFSGITARVSEVLESIKTLDSATVIRAPRPEESTEAAEETRPLDLEWLEAWRERGEERREASTSAADDRMIALDDVSIVSPDGRLLVEHLTFDVPRGKNIMVTGPNGCGKSSLFRVIRDLWPAYAGEVQKPAGRDIVFVPQNPYCVIGTLRDQIIYPDSVEDMKRKGVTDNDLANLLAIVDPGNHILDMWEFDNIRNWYQAFSGGQKQRVALARCFYALPRYSVMDECSSAISADTEGNIYVAARKLGITLFTISHRPKLQEYHEYQLRLDGHGGWDLLTRDEVMASGSFE